MWLNPHNKGHILDLVVSYGLCSILRSVNDFILQTSSEKTVRKNYLTTEVAENFISLFHKTPTIVLLSACGFTIDAFNTKLQSIIDRAKD